MRPAQNVSPARFLTAAGVANRWIYVAWLLFATFIVVARMNGERANVAPYFFFFLVPIAAATGLVSCGRRGQLDLLLGAGQTRADVWRTAVVRMLLLPAALAAVLLAISGPLDAKLSLGATMLRLLAVLLFTGGISFAAGMIDPPFVTPVFWLLTRMLFIMVPAGLSIVVQLGKGIDVPSAGALIVAAFAIPEIVLEPNMPATFAVIQAAIGIVALAISKRWFERAELGGKRS